MAITERTPEEDAGHKDGHRRGEDRQVEEKYGIDREGQRDPVIQHASVFQALDPALLFSCLKTGGA